MTEQFDPFEEIPPGLDAEKMATFLKGNAHTVSHTALFEHALTHSSPKVQRIALRTLLSRGDFLPSAFKSLKSRSSKIRRGALIALINCQEENLSQVVEMGLKSSDSTWKHAALQALSAIGKPAAKHAMDVVNYGLKEENIQTKQLALVALSRFQQDASHTAGFIVNHALTSSNKQTRRKALIAIKAIAGTQAAEHAMPQIEKLKTKQKNYPEVKQAKTILQLHH